MKNLIYNTAASDGGALTILKQYYDKAVLDSENQYKFIVSTDCLKDTENVKVDIYKEPKQSWLKRLNFDKKKAPKIINDYEPDLVYNLQNVLIKGVQAKQILYMHQPLPFTNIKISFFKSRKLWIYQNVIGKLIKKSCKNAEEIIVQTEWIKEAVIKKCKISCDKIRIEQPRIDLSKIKKYTCQDKIEYFYPASGVFYKNHKVIVDALISLSKSGQYPSVIFTLKGNEDKNIIKLKRKCENNKLKVKFIGSIALEEVYDYYSRTALLFPSYIETFGLPLLEAREAGCPIIASDMPFAREILKDYENVNFFKHSKCQELEKLL